MVENGRNGFLIAPGDAGALAAAVKSLAMDCARRTEMGRAGRVRAENHFDAARNYPAVLALLKRCADVARGGVSLPQAPIVAGDIRRPAA